jgi:hypothetical protein
MKRRDLLKTAGTMILTAPAVRASALVNSNAEPAPQSGAKTLIVTFAGAFCFWQDGNRYKVMVPPVPVYPSNDENSHLPWAGTTANAKRLLGFDNFTLTIGGYTPPSGVALPQFAGTNAFTYPQEKEGGGGKPPLLNLLVPMPSQVIGIQPTGAKMVCQPGKTCPSSENYQTFASGLSFVYQNVDLANVLITPDSGKGPEDSYKPCFTNDAFLQEATLGIHLTPLNWVVDRFHKHASYVWQQMLSMYPWMQEYIKGIDFCDFDPSACPAGCKVQNNQAHPKQNEPRPVTVGPSNDCQVPIMVLPPPGAKSLNQGAKK